MVRDNEMRKALEADATDQGTGSTWRAPKQSTIVGGTRCCWGREWVCVKWRGNMNSSQDASGDWQGMQNIKQMEPLSVRKDGFAWRDLASAAPRLLQRKLTASYVGKSSVARPPRKVGMFCVIDELLSFEGFSGPATRGPAVARGQQATRKEDG